MTDHTGKYLYAANRSNATFVCYQIKDAKTGLLSNPLWYPCGGKGGEVPRHFNIHPSNNWLLVANQEGNTPNISIFKINHEKNGALEWKCQVEVGCPTSIMFFDGGEGRGGGKKEECPFIEIQSKL